MAVKRRFQDGRLLYFSESGGGNEFWVDHWSAQTPSEKTYADAEKGIVKWISQAVEYLPRTGKIVDTGCGLGEVVVGLRACGYDAEGIEISEETVQMVSKVRPGVPVAVGDALRMNAPDGYYTGLISLGVVEHRLEGPEPFLAEAHRVLGSSGIALISVPTVNTLRLAKAKLGLYRSNVSGLDFYQYAFTPAEFTRLLRRAGFQVIARMQYGGLKGLTDEVPALRKMFRAPFAGPRLKRALRYGIKSPLTGRNMLGHMELYVCAKEPAAVNGASRS